MITNNNLIVNCNNNIHRKLIINNQLTSIALINTAATNDKSRKYNFDKFTNNIKGIFIGQSY